MSNSLRNQIFRFLELPPELRDKIYENLTSDEVTVTRGGRSIASLSVMDCPLLSILLVNRQIKDEYHKVAAKKIRLIYSDHGSFEWILPPLPVKYGDVQKAEVRVFVLCKDSCPEDTAKCGAANDLQQTRRFMENIVHQLPQLWSLEVILGLWCKAGQRFEWPHTPHADRFSHAVKKLPEITNLTRLHIYQTEEDCRDVTAGLFSRRMIVRWTKYGGWESFPRRKESVASEALQDLPEWS